MYPGALRCLTDKMQKFLIAIIILLVPSVALGENPSLKGASLFMKQEQPLRRQHVFEVTVRGIRGEGSLESTSLQDISLEDDIEFLRQKLSKLPFAQYRVVTKVSDLVRSNSTRTFNLVNGQIVNLQPIDTTGKAVTMWMRWIGGDGMEILDTRIHFACDETMLAGVDGDQSNGLILAITVSPQAMQSVE